MRSSSLLVALATSVPSCLAGPVVKKADFDPLPGGDIDILNYALTLEYLERKFYQDGLKNYTKEDFCKAGFSEDVYHNLKTIAYDEAQHVALLSGALGSAAVKEATYSFPSTSASSFLSLASVLEGVGVSAYLGAAAAIADKKSYLPVAGSILTVEARHSAYIRSALRQAPFPKPYDTPLDFRGVFSLAAQFITGFAPGDKPLPIEAFPKISVVVGDKKAEAGKTPLTFTGAAKAASEAGLVMAGEKVYAVFYSGLDTYYAEVTMAGDDYTLAAIPTGDAAAMQLPPSGQVYVVLSKADGKTVKVSDENTISGVGVVEVKPPVV